jgi:restriction system protein
VRAGEGGYQIEEFERSACVGIGWSEVGDFSTIRSLEQMRERVASAYPDSKPGALANSASMAFKFKSAIKKGDRVVSYDPQRRQYLLGTIQGDYEFRPGLLPNYPHIRRVTWQGRVDRDALSPVSRNTLGSVLTLFAPGEEVLRELEKGVSAPPPSDRLSEGQEVEREEFEEIRRDTIGRAHELIKDKIQALSPDDMEELVAALLRGMGYKARVTPKGPDRGRDVIASPDGLGFQQPRIVAEVKHRPRETMGSEKIRSFSGGLRGDDRGLYVSIGGFSREARYEADRSSVPITLVDLDDLASLITEHYDAFDIEGRALMPLTRVYWPS